MKIFKMLALILIIFPLTPVWDIVMAEKSGNEKYSLTVILLDGDGDPIPNVNVKLFNHIGSWMLFCEGITNQSGIVVFTELPSQAYTIIPILNNKFGLKSGYVNLTEDKQITIKDNYLRSLTFRFLLLDGRTPLNNATVTAEMSHDYYVVEEKVNESGMAKVKLLFMYWNYEIENGVYTGGISQWCDYNVNVSRGDTALFVFGISEFEISYIQGRNIYTIDVIVNELPYGIDKTVVEISSITSNVSISNSIIISSSAIITSKNASLNVKDSVIIMGSSITAKQELELSGNIKISNSKLIKRFTPRDITGQPVMERGIMGISIKASGKISITNSTVEVGIDTNGLYLDAYNSNFSGITTYSYYQLSLNNSTINFLYLYSSGVASLYHSNVSNLKLTINVKGSIEGIKPGFVNCWSTTENLTGTVDYYLLINRTYIENWSFTFTWCKEGERFSIANSTIYHISLGDSRSPIYTLDIINSSIDNLGGYSHYVTVKNSKLRGFAITSPKLVNISNSIIQRVNLVSEGPVVGIREGVSGGCSGLSIIKNSTIEEYSVRGVISYVYDSFVGSSSLTGWVSGVESQLYYIYGNATYMNSTIGKLEVHGLGLTIGVELIDCNLHMEKPLIEGSAIIKYSYSLYVMVLTNYTVIPNALVSICRLPENNIVAYNYTNDEGIAIFDKLPSRLVTEYEDTFLGDYRVVVNYTGSKVSEEHIQLNSSKLLRFDLSSVPMVRVKYASVVYGSSTLIPIVAENIEHLGAYDIKVNYDPNILIINGVLGGREPFNSPIYSIDNENGILRANQFTSEVENTSKKITILYLNASALKIASKSITLNVTIISLIDAKTGEEITPRIPISGVINVSYLKLTDIYINLEPAVIFDNSVAIPIQMKTHGILKMDITYNVTVNVSYKGNITLQASFPGESPFSSVPSLSISKNIFTVDYVNVSGGDWNKTICYLPIILNGSAEETVEIATNITVIIRDSSGGEIKPNIHLSGSLQFIRGDANGDGKVNIADAMFIAQYLAGNRPLSQLNPLNAASVKHDSGGKDAITIADAMFIAQYLAGLRNSLFELEE